MSLREISPAEFRRFCPADAEIEPSPAIERAWFVTPNNDYAAVALHNPLTSEWQYRIYRRTKYGVCELAASDEGFRSRPEHVIRGRIQMLLITDELERRQTGRVKSPN